MFRGRIAEDFKLRPAPPFVRVGAVRTALLSAAPVLADAVIAGEGRDRRCALAWLNLTEARALIGADIQAEGEFVLHDVLQDAGARLADHNDPAGSAAASSGSQCSRAQQTWTREITDKGYVNQRQVLNNRSALIEVLYADPPPAHVILPEDAHPSSAPLSSPVPGPIIVAGHGSIATHYSGRRIPAKAADRHARADHAPGREHR